MRFLLVASALLVLSRGEARSQEKGAAPEPRVVSLWPFTIPLGKAQTAILRGRGLKSARALEIDGEGVRGRVVHVETQPPAEEGARSAAVDLIHVEFSSESNAKPGTRGLRVLTENGVSNQLEITLSAEAVVAESEAPNPIRMLPVVVTGQILERGEVDTFWIDAVAGQTITFQARSGHGSFDPLLSLFQSAPSWLDGHHMERIAFNDEPLFFPGLSTDAHLVHTFRKAGKYCVKIQSSSGQGSADAVYELRILPGAEPSPAPRPKLKENAWEERQFTRRLVDNLLVELAGRGAVSAPGNSVESYRAARVGSGEQVPTMRLPGVVEGRIAGPAEAHRVKIHIEKSESIAIEIETPDATMPRFNPVILLFEPGGTEVATNVYTKRNNNGLYMMKMIQPKIALPLHAPGEYEMEIRDITTDRAGNDFRYRVLVRRQIPHVGKVEVAEEQINVRAGGTRELNITVEREEGFNGLVAFSAENVPAGVTVISAAPKPVEKPPLPNGGKLERYTPIVQNSALILMAASDAVPSESAAKIRIVARPMAGGKLGQPIVVKELPLTILPRSAT